MASSLDGKTFARAARALETAEAAARGGDHLLALADLQLARANLGFLISDQVTDARARGATWAEIGARLGCSKQAAEQKYGDRHVKSR